MRLASIGFNQHEQGLLARQLKVLVGRTAAPWLYVGEAREADLIIVRDAAGATEGQGLLAYADSAGGRGGDLRLDWPLRMFALLELLLEAERRLAAGRRSETCVAQQLAALRQEGWLDLAGQRIHLQPDEDRLAATVSDFDALLGVLCCADFDTELALQPGAAPGQAGALPFSATLSQVIWALALRSGASRTRDWDAHRLLFRIASWPHFGEWQVSPPLLRLAALYARQPASIASGCELAAVDEDTVRGFLLACELCRLGLTIHQAETPPPAPQASPARTGSLLQRLRERLGISFARKR